MHSQRDNPFGLGCPIQTSRDHSPVTGSLWLFAGSHVFHRLLTPRHPPCALRGLIAPTARRRSAGGTVLRFPAAERLRRCSPCQGHQLRYSRWPGPSPSSRRHFRHIALFSVSIRRGTEKPNAIGAAFCEATPTRFFSAADRATADIRLSKSPAPRPSRAANASPNSHPVRRPRLRCPCIALAGSSSLTIPSPLSSPSSSRLAPRPGFWGHPGDNPSPPRPRSCSLAPYP